MSKEKKITIKMGGDIELLKDFKAFAEKRGLKCVWVHGKKKRKQPNEKS